jgi:hypothetical protein
MLKKRGRGEGFHRIGEKHYGQFIEKLMASKINYGFDSCGAGRLLKQNINEDIKKYITPCESTRESCYINVNGEFFPCSFGENGQGIDVANCHDFVEDVWCSQKTHNWRMNLIENNCNCPLYEI